MIRLHGSDIAKVDTDKAQAQPILFSDHPTVGNTRCQYTLKQLITLLKQSESLNCILCH